MNRTERIQDNWLAITTFRDSLKVRVHILKACTASQVEVSRYFNRYNNGKMAEISAGVMMQEFTSPPFNPAGTESLQFIGVLAGEGNAWVCTMYKVTAEGLEFLLDLDDQQDSNRQLIERIELNRSENEFIEYLSNIESNLIELN